MTGTTFDDVGDRREAFPALLDLVDVGHVGHRAAGVEVGQDDPLVRAGEHVGRLGHEVHAAEDDVGGLVVVRREPGQLEGVAAGIGPLDDLVALVVVAEDQEPLAQLGLGRGDPARRARPGTRGCSGPAMEPAFATCESPEGYGLRSWPAGTAWSPTAGLSAPELICRRNSRPAQPSYKRSSRCQHVRRAGSGANWRHQPRRMGGCSGPNRRRSRTPRVRTSSRTRAAG